jgi:hypothetical protein
MFRALEQNLQSKEKEKKERAAIPTKRKKRDKNFLEQKKKE